MVHMFSRIAAVTGGRSAAAQPLFEALAAEWRAAGTKIAGVIAEPHGPLDRTCTAGVLRDINSGGAYQIHLETPPAGTSCDIDAAGVRSACAAVLKSPSLPHHRNRKRQLPLQEQLGESPQTHIGEIS
ncbi:MAG: hypothetical protein C3F11_05520 [Methylocystaceae bacterium]|nr:MAG: hypothetical protein C3F11_05520 [Methylocystaceae bacterium]